MILLRICQKSEKTQVKISPSPRTPRDRLRRNLTKLNGLVRIHCRVGVCRWQNQQVIHSAAVRWGSTAQSQLQNGRRRGRNWRWPRTPRLWVRQIENWLRDICIIDMRSWWLVLLIPEFIKRQCSGGRTRSLWFFRLRLEAHTGLELKKAIRRVVLLISKPAMRIGGVRQVCLLTTTPIITAKGNKVSVRFISRCSKPPVLDSHWVIYHMKWKIRPSDCDFQFNNHAHIQYFDSRFVFNYLSYLYPTYGLLWTT